MNKCKHCNKEVKQGERHTCPTTGETYSSDSGDWLLSFALGAATDSSLLGGLIGGDFGAAVLGDMMDGNLFD
jgi:hypothetical protein